MTVVLAVRCVDGLVLAGDSQVTDDDRGLSFPASKLHPLGDAAAWGGSGARSVLVDVESVLADSATEVLEADNVAHAVQERMLGVLEYHYEHFIPEVPGKAGRTSPSAYLLAAGYSRGEPWIVEVDPHGMVSRYEEVGFQAIGSGAAMAQQAIALLAHFQMREREVRYGVITAVRVLDALMTTSPSVGGPLDVYRITSDGAEHYGEDELAQVREDVARWHDREQQVLDELFDRP